MIFIKDWKNEKKNGKGIFTYFDVEKYEGDFINNFKNGKGKNKYDNVDEYEGDY